MGKSCSNYSQGGGNIGRITIEFNEQDKEFEIYPRRRKVYHDGVELDLMAK